jgi:methyl-accepting chemotaxis protein
MLKYAKFIIEYHRQNSLKTLKVFILMLNHFKVGQRLLIGFGSIMLFLVSISILSIYQSYTLSAITESLYQHPYTVGHAIQETHTVIVKMRSTLKDIIAVRTLDEMVQRAKQVDEYEIQVYELLKIAKERYLGDPQDVQTVIELFAQWKPVRDTIFSRFDLDDRSAVTQMIIYGVGIEHFNKLEDALYKVLVFGENKAQTFYDHAQHQADVMRYWLIVLSITLTILGISLTLYISHTITKPLSIAVKAAEQLATGNLLVTIQTTGKDETAQLLDAMQKMANNLRMTIAQLIQSSQHINNIVHQLSNNGQELLTGAEQQNIAVTTTYDSVSSLSKATTQVAESTETLTNNVAETSASIEEMAASIESVANSTAELNDTVDMTSQLIAQMVNTIEQIANNSRNVSEFSQTMVQKAQQGGSAMHDTMLSMGDISDTMQGIVQVIEKLNGSHQQINDIINTISEIARQTNLLALNAAIEAARAGEHGRGFTVVADEVRKLATRSATATQEIINLISAIRKDSQEAIVATTAGAEKVLNGVDLTKQAGGILDSIVHSIHSSNKMMVEISAATARQAHASEEVMKNVDAIRLMTKEVDVAAKEQAVGTQQIMTAIGVMNTMTEEVANSAAQQTISSESIIAVTENVATISSQNRKLSSQLVEITTELKRQSDSLYGLAQQFKV